MNAIRNFYSMTEVSCAKVTLSLYGVKDKFGGDFVNIFQVIWAARVMVWFRNYISKIREIAASLRTGWNKAVSRVWSLIRTKVLNLPDTPQ